MLAIKIIIKPEVPDIPKKQDFAVVEALFQHCIKAT